jgi:MFS family permease
MLVLAMAFFGQWSGNGPVSYYYPTILRGAGIKSAHTRLLYNGMQNVVSFAGAIFGAVYTDKWGRRPQLLVSTACLVVIFSIVSALVATNLKKDSMGRLVYEAGSNTPLIKRQGQAKAVIAMFFLFGFIYSTGYTPLQQLYPVECLRYESRAKGMAFYNFWVNIANFYNTFVTGIAFAGAGWKVCFDFTPFPSFSYPPILSHFYILLRSLTLTAVLLPLHLLGHLRVRLHILLLRRNTPAHARRNQRYLQKPETSRDIAQQDAHRHAWKPRRDRDAG